MGEGEPEIGEADAEQARQQHGLASMAVAEGAPEGGGEELHEGIDRHQQGDGLGRGMEMLGIEGQQRDDDAEAHQIHEDRQKDRRQGTDFLHLPCCVGSSSACLCRAMAGGGHG